jgi:hypothetical protein
MVVLPWSCGRVSQDFNCFQIPRVAHSQILLHDKCLWLAGDSWSHFIPPSTGLVLCFCCDPQAMGFALAREGRATNHHALHYSSSWLINSVQVHIRLAPSPQPSYMVFSLLDTVFWCPKSVWSATVLCVQVLELLSLKPQLLASPHCQQTAEGAPHHLWAQCSASSEILTTDTCSTLGGWGNQPSLSELLVA